MAPKPEWCARAPVTKAARSFGAPRALPVRAQKENRYKPKVKSRLRPAQGHGRAAAQGESFEDAGR